MTATNPKRKPGAILAATLLSGLLFATAIPTANAVPTRIDPSDLTTNQSLTVTSGSMDINGKTLVAVPLAYYSNAFTEDSAITGFDLEDAGNAFQIDQALTFAGITHETGYDSANPMLWVAQNLLDSKESPYAGKLRDFLTELGETLGSESGTSLAQGSDAKTMTANVKPGIYLILDETKTGQASIPMLTGTGINGITQLKGDDEDATTLGTVEYKASNITVTKKVEEGSESAAIGDQVVFTLETTVPNWTGYFDFQFLLEDTMGEGLTFNDIHLIKVNNLDLSTDLYSKDVSGNNLTITFGKDSNLVKDAETKEAFPVGAPVYIEYYATLDKDAVIEGEGNPNSIAVEYSSNPDRNDSGHTRTRVEGDTVHVYTGKTTVFKHDKQNNPLAGAKFQLFDTDNEGTALKLVKLGDGHYRLADSTEDAGTVTEMESPTDGIIRIDGVDNGYKVKETSSPFNQPLLPEFTIDVTAPTEADGDSTTSITRNDVNNLTAAYNTDEGVSVLNARNLKEMPQTGAAWLGIYAAGSLFLLTGASLLLFRRKHTVA